MLINVFACIFTPFFILKLISERSRLLSLLRVKTYKILGAIISSDVRIQRQVRLYGVKNIIINEGSFLGEGTKLVAYDANISIGRNCLIAADCIMITRNHNYSVREIDIKKQGYSNKPIVIKDNVWLGYRVVILPGITIGEGAIVAANSVVTKNIEPYAIYGGNPAKLIKSRGNDEDISHL